jgi:DNA repair protein RadC
VLADPHGAIPRRREKAMGYTRDVLGHYTITGPMTENDVLAAAEDILRRKLERQGILSSPRDSAQFLRMRLGHLLHEEFHAVWLDNQHQVLAVDKLFCGSIDGASVHPREVVRSALRYNAAAVIFAHNHPSGNPEPSAADRAITQRLREALQLIDVRLLDHIIIGAQSTTSMAERGQI